jgi:hypothetical protein
VHVLTKDTLQIVPDENGKLTAIDTGYEKAYVDSKNIYFEALNLKNAQKRLAKFKKGEIKELCNLKEPGNGINFW